MKIIGRLTAGLLTVLGSSAQQAQRPANIVLTNDHMELTIQGTGGTLARLLLR
ncbi:MAG: hypothetical protein M3Y27_29225 [Acidobacteriota bacterium]|nr:hypothetical protein [Acidobacteriota bacterium]